MTVEQLITECNFNEWQQCVVRKGRETLGGGYPAKMIKRYGNMVVDTIWCVEGAIIIRVR